MLPSDNNFKFDCFDFMVCFQIKNVSKTHRERKSVLLNLKISIYRIGRGFQSSDRWPSRLDL